MQLQNALSAVRHAVNRTNPLLRITVHDEHAVVTAANDDLEIAVLTCIDGLPPEEFVVNASICDLVADLEGEIEFTRDDTKLRVKGPGRYSFAIQDKASLPSFDVEKGPIVTLAVDGADFKGALRYVKGTMTTNDIRQWLVGVTLFPAEEGLLVVASNGVTLGQVTIPAGDCGSFPACIMPPKTVGALLRLLPDGDTKIELHGKTLVVRAGDLRFVSPTIDGANEALRRHAESLALRGSVRLPASKMRSAFDRVALAADPNRGIALTVRGGSRIECAADSGTRDALESIECVADQAAVDAQITVSASLMVPALEAAADTDISLDWLTNQNGQNYLRVAPQGLKGYWLVSPLRE